METPTHVKHLQELRQLIRRLRSANSPKEKKVILSSSFNSNSCPVHLLRLVYNPHIRFRLTSSKVHKPTESLESRSLFETLCLFQTGELSGNAAIQAWQDILFPLPQELREVANLILDKDLKVGVGLKTLNAALKSCKIPTLPEFNVSLGALWKGEEVWDEGDWFVSRKLDGVRCLAILRYGEEPLLLSRSGREITTLPGIVDSLSGWKGQDITFRRGGCIAGGKVEDDFQGIVSLIRRKNAEVTKRGFSCI